MGWIVFVSLFVITSNAWTATLSPDFIKSESGKVDAEHSDAVRVLLQQSKTPFVLTSLGPISLSNDQEKINIYDSHFSMEARYKKTIWHIVVRYHKRNEFFEMSGERLTVAGLELRWAGQQIDFPLQISAKKNDYFLVGVMSMDRYLYGVIPHEMPSSWPLEALKAQVVASRSYALWKSQVQKNAIYDLHPSVMDQVFQLAKENESVRAPAKVEQAILATSGQYLVSPEHKILKTYFHSDCGGTTSTPQEVWGTALRELTSTKDSYCQQRDSGWTSYWEKDRLKNKMLNEFFLPLNLDLVDVVVRSQSKTLRSEWVDLIFSKGIFKRVRGEEIRRILGYDKIKSTMFAVDKTSQGWTFNGRGFGHGVGMCQHGARSMAEMGQGYQQILAHYYPLATLRTLQVTPQKLQTVSAL